MSRRLAYFAGTLALAFIAATMSGCVERRFVLEADKLGTTSYPPGTICFVNGKWAGPAPTDQSFTYYGTYRFTFLLDGYDPLTVDEKISAPWWSIFPLEFFVENLCPFTIRDVRYIRRPLEPRQDIPYQVILQNGTQLRAQGQMINPTDGVICVPNPGAASLPPQSAQPDVVGVPNPGVVPVPPPSSTPGFVPIPPQ